MNFSLKRQKRQLLDIRRGDVSSRNEQSAQDEDEPGPSSSSSVMPVSPSSLASAANDQMSAEERISLLYSLIDPDYDADSEGEIVIDFDGFTPDQVHDARQYQQLLSTLTSGDETDYDDSESESDQQQDHDLDEDSRQSQDRLMSRKSRSSSGRRSRSHNSSSLTASAGKVNEGIRKKIVNRKSSKKLLPSHRTTTSSSSKHLITDSSLQQQQLPSSPSSVSLSPLVSWPVNGDAATSSIVSGDRQTPASIPDHASDFPALEDHDNQVAQAVDDDKDDDDDDDHEVVSKHKHQRRERSSRSSPNDMPVDEDRLGGGADAASLSLMRKKRIRHQVPAIKVVDVDRPDASDMAIMQQSPGTSGSGSKLFHSQDESRDRSKSSSGKMDKKRAAISQAQEYLQNKWRERVMRCQQSNSALGSGTSNMIESPVTPGYFGEHQPESPAGSFSGGSSARVPGGILREARLQVDESTLNQIRTQTSDDSDDGDSDRDDEKDDDNESDATDPVPDAGDGDDDEEDDENLVTVSKRSASSPDKKSRNRSKSPRKRKRSSSRSPEKGRKHSPSEYMFCWSLYDPIDNFMSETEKKNPGTIECAICGAIKYYSHKQKRFGVFACETCAKFFSNFLRDPKAYYCNNTGQYLVTACDL
jgi:hypothetical protein